MNGRLASILFLGVSIVLAVLLLTQKIEPVTTGAIFAGALVLFGCLSRGFKRRTELE